MSGLPDGWTFIALHEIADVNPRVPRESLADDTDITFLPMSAVEAETGHINREQSRAWANLKTGYTTFRDGDVLFAKITPCMENGKVAICSDLLNGIGAGSTEFHVIRPIHQILNPQYVFFYLLQRSFRSDARLAMKGAAGQLRVPAQFLAERIIPLPPLAEQRRIAAEIEKHLTILDVAAGICTDLGRKLRTLSKSAFNVIQPISRSIDMRRVRLRDIAKMIQYGSSTKASADPDGVAIIRMGNLSSDGRLFLNSLKYLPAEHSELPALLLQNGDVLFNRTNSAELVGKSCVYRGYPFPCTFASYLIRIRTTQECVPEFLAASLNSPYGRRWISSVVTQQVGQANVNGTKLANFEFQLPPIADQQRLLSTFERSMSLIWNIEKSLSRNLAQAARLRQAILAKAFSGQLVPQDPNDEPASVLLERIRTERRSASRPVKPRRSRSGTRGSPVPVSES